MWPVQTTVHIQEGQWDRRQRRTVWTVCAHCRAMFHFILICSVKSSGFLVQIRCVFSETSLKFIRSYNDIKMGENEPFRCDLIYYRGLGKRVNTRKKIISNQTSPPSTKWRKWMCWSVFVCAGADSYQTQKKLQSNNFAAMHYTTLSKSRDTTSKLDL